jgi:16S rRNA G966 N2-methylase RsmD
VFDDFKTVGKLRKSSFKKVISEKFRKSKVKVKNSIFPSLGEKLVGAFFDTFFSTV